MSTVSIQPTALDRALASLYRDASKLPAQLSAELDDINKKLKACRDAIYSAKINKFSLDLIPYNFIEKRLKIEQEIINFCIEEDLYNKNKLSDYYLKAILVEKYLVQNNLNVPHGYSNKILFEFLHGRTYRVYQKGKSFPILNFPKEKRDIIKPNNDYLVEFDLNSADLRSLYLCLDIQQPKKDIYQDLIEQHGLFINRDRLKEEILIWVHKPSIFEQYNSFFNRDEVINKYKTNDKYYNYYGFELACDEEKAFGYIIQSTTSIFFLLSMYETIKYLTENNYESKVLFGIYDSLVLDYKFGEDLNPIKKSFEQQFYSKAKIGKHFGDMREI
jgi:hypothetical protein